MKRIGLIARSPLAWLLIAALALRLGAGVWWQSRLPPGAKFDFGDSESYWALAGAIARGDPYEFGAPPARAFRMPGYPLLLAGLFRVYGGEPPIAAARALNAVLGTCAVYGVYALGSRLFDRRTGLAAATVAAIYPGAIGTSVFVLSEAAFCPLMLAELVFATIAWQSTGGAERHAQSSHTEPLPERGDRRDMRAILAALASGLCAGAATLVRPSWLLFTPLVVVVSLLAGRNAGQHLRLGAAMIVGLVAVMAPWWLRNARVIGHFVPTTLEVGASLYDGLNPRATGGSDMSFRAEFVAREEQEPAGNESLEYRLDRRLRDAALDWAAAHPGAALRLAAVKFARLWNVWPNEPEFRSLPLRLIVFVSYVPVVVLGLVGAIRFTPRAWPVALCWLPALYVTALHMVFVSSIRYREPAMLPAAVLAAATVLHTRKETADS